MPFPEGVPQQLASLPAVSEVNTNGSLLESTAGWRFDPLLRIVSSGYVKMLHVEEPTLEEIFLAFYSDSDGGEA